jgi:metallo-beta-lactamase family protein
VHTLGGFSAHAGQTDLLAWLSAIDGTRPRVALTHGEDRARRALSRKIKHDFGIMCEMPGMEEVISL